MKTAWHENARYGFLQVLRYIKNNFGIKAKREFVEEVNICVKLLCQHPEMGCVDSLFENRVEIYRSIIVNNRSKLVYRIDGDVINIVAFWDCRRDPVAQTNKVK